MKPSLYTRPSKPLTIPARAWRRDAKAPEPREIAAPVVVDRYTECHVTPPDVAALMADQFNAPGDRQTLEPSAGTGALVQAMLDAGQAELHLTLVERHIELANGLRRRFPGAGLFNHCFLEYAQQAEGKIEFPQIIMNPPFSKVKAHMSAALSLLGCNGHSEPAELVALVPITYEHPDAYTVTELGPETFSTAKVRTKIIKIEKE
jgi:phospholipid N-methyltransferase